MSTRVVYLVPGFFGFTSLGAVNYFYRVRDTLADMLAERGIRADVIECPTQPTGSIRRRATTLLEHVADTGGLSADELFFVGHSTGGLDLRLLLTPGVRLDESDVEAQIGAMTRSAIFVATPQYGTPIANFFTTLPGRQLLEFLTALATTGGGRISILAAARLLGFIARLDDRFGREHTLLDVLAERVFSKLSTSPDAPMWQFLRDIARDQGAIIQLTPESMHLFNAAVVDRQGVHYASLVTSAPPPPGNFAVSDFRTLVRAASASAFAFMYLLASREHSQYPYPPFDSADFSLPFTVGAGANDGVVSTWSQAYGRILDVVVADHLDVVGQFPNAGGDTHADWLPSGSRFDEARFRTTWATIADEITRASGQARP